MNESITMKPIYKIKDVQLLCHTEQLRVRVVKEYLDESQDLIKKEHAVLTYSLVNIGDEEAEKKVKDLIGEVCLAQAKRIGELEEIVGNISGEVRDHKKDKKELSEQKEILQATKESILKENEELKQKFSAINFINEKVYQENQILKSANEKILKDIVVLDENIKNLNEIIENKKAK